MDLDGPILSLCLELNDVVLFVPVNVLYQIRSNLDALVLYLHLKRTGMVYHVRSNPDDPMYHIRSKLKKVMLRPPAAVDLENV